MSGSPILRKPEETFLTPLPVVSKLTREQLLGKLGGYGFSRIALYIFGIVPGPTAVVRSRLYIRTWLLVGVCCGMWFFSIVRCDLISTFSMSNMSSFVLV